MSSANDIKQFTKSPWSTDQSYRISELTSSTARTKLYTARLEKEGSLYLYNINTEEEVKLLLIPDQLAESYSAKMVTQSPFGTVTPLNFYVGGDAKKISFNFDIHEDIQNVNGSIYNLISKIEKMKEPTYYNGALYDPIIYFQLGTQFAGKGHIDTSVTYNKPFRNGRYINISVNMSFTFHEEFEDDLTSVGDTYIGGSLISEELRDVFEDQAAIDDFFKLNTDPQYFIEQTYGTKKFESYFNVLVTESILTMYTGGSVSDSTSRQRQAAQRVATKSLNDILQGKKIEDTDGINTYILQLLDLFYDFREILNVGYAFSSNDVIKANLNILKNNFDNLMKDYRNTGGTPASSIVGYGGYSMTEAQKVSFEALANMFISMLEKQINAYSELTGGGQ